MILKNITSPQLIINEKQVKRNIHLMNEKALKHDLIFRPHFKTHQSAGIGEWFQEIGVNKIAVSSVGMAKYFANHNWKDITIAFPLNIRELKDIENLAKDINLQVLISSVESMNYLVHNLKQKVNFYIKIDTGYKRAGITSENFTLLNEILQRTEKNKNLKFLGFLAHFGHSYYANNKEEVMQVFEDGNRQLIALKSHFIDQFPNLNISIGDTPSCSLANDFTGIDEIRPGNFTFYDLMQNHIGVCNEKDIAVTVACPVVDKYPDREQIMVYGGAVHFSKEYIFDQSGNKIYGKVVNINENGWSLIKHNYFLSGISQEHGIITADKQFIEKLKIGDLIGILPIHSCLTANLFKKYHTLDNQIIEMWKGN